MTDQHGTADYRTILRKIYRQATGDRRFAGSGAVAGKLGILGDDVVQAMLDARQRDHILNLVTARGNDRIVSASVMQEHLTLEGWRFVGLRPPQVGDLPT